jgi:hypothetical protein
MSEDAILASALIFRGNLMQVAFDYFITIFSFKNCQMLGLASGEA